MSNNVIILGAGFSYDAGVPLLGNFIERMWEYSIRGKAGNKKLSLEELSVLNEALEIRKEMDGYHGRVAFDDRNIEDILSMLAFNQIGGNRSDKNKLKVFTKAIATTIELACNIKHSGIPINSRYKINNEGAEIYRRFWLAMFQWYKDEKSLPTIITFNYDLVLERALMQVLINKNYNYSESSQLPFENLTFDYQYPYFPAQNYNLEYATYDGYSGRDVGTILRHSPFPNPQPSAQIELLKLHGSLNFPDNKLKPGSSLSTTNIIENPYILPPVSNKQSNTSGNQSWAIAMQRLREAKNVIFVGYSLPKTDMYMQFFLKAALGPNQGLNKIFVFDPVLWKQSSLSDEMHQRYELCFAEQLRKRIDFNPNLNSKSSVGIQNLGGTTEHFVDILENNASSILF